MISSQTYRNILNFVMFELGWLACVMLSQAWALSADRHRKQSTTVERMGTRNNA